MARLNDPPAASLDSIEALKRRFIRQNREIARVNSTQAIRIQNLEISNSAIIAENLVLREQVIKLQYELDRGSSRADIANANSVKAKLEAKLAELGSLVAELGNVRPTKRESTVRRQSVAERRSPPRSPGPKAWRGTLTVSESARMEDGRLPPILENKLFPRKTLDSEELRGILSDSVKESESPDVGPPPIASFEKASPLKYSNVSKTIESTNKSLSSTPKLNNIEARRKRRESSSVKDITGMDLADFSGESDNAANSGGAIVLGQSLRTGAKRKFSAREEEDPNLSSQPVEEEGFQFSRQTKASASENLVAAKQTPTGSTSNSKLNGEKCGFQPPPRDRIRESLTASKSRRALGEKSVNTDPVVSPVKKSAGSANDIINAAKKDANRRSNEREGNQDKMTAAKAINNVARQAETRNAPKGPLSDKTEMPAVTPGPPDLDLFSPTYTEPSATRPESRDTPPPPDLHKNATGGEGRLSRRSRSSVSYAEPSLRAKMRRPTKELVDAVGADERVQRAVSAKSEIEKTGDEHDGLFNKPADKPKARMVVIKKEDGTIESTDWKTLPQATDLLLGRPEPTSPLQHKTSTNDSAADLPASVITDRKRRASVLPSIHDESSSKPDGKPTSGHYRSTSASNSAIAALVTGSKKPARTQTEFQEPAEKANGISNKSGDPHDEADPNIYEVEESPAKSVVSDHSRQAASSTAITNNKTAIRGSRRSSSVSDLGAFKKSGGVSVGDMARTSGTGTGTSGTSYLKERRRRDTMASNTSSTITANATIVVGGDNRPSSAASDVNPTSTNKSSTTSGTSGTGTVTAGSVMNKGDKDSIGRSERAAQRRKSMML